MKINTNMAATYMINNLNKANNNASTVMQRLSSGLKINSAKDNPSGLAISNKLDSQVRDLSQASQNVMNGISLVQTAEGALNEVSDMLTRLKQLTVQGQNGTYNSTDKESVQEEINSLIEEITNIKDNTSFNNIKILSTDNVLPIQIGFNSGQTMDIEGTEINLTPLLEGPLKDIKIDDNDLSQKVEDSITQVNSIRGTLGAYQNRLEHISNNLGTHTENTTSSLSRIQDADMAEEMSNYTRYNILSQSGIAMLAQANQRPQQILQLLNS